MDPYAIVMAFMFTLLTALVALAVTGARRRERNHLHLMRGYEENRRVHDAHFAKVVAFMEETFGFRLEEEDEKKPEE